LKACVADIVKIEELLDDLGPAEFLVLEAAEIFLGAMVKGNQVHGIRIGVILRTCWKLASDLGLMSIIVCVRLFRHRSGGSRKS